MDDLLCGRCGFAVNPVFFDALALSRAGLAVPFH
jgi:hypothetical protein